MENRIRKYLAHNGMVSVMVMDGTKMVSEARNTHNLSNVVTAALGRTLIMTSIMSCKLKEKGNRITVQIKGDGPIGSMVTCGDGNLKIKGYASTPNVELPLNSIGKLDVAKAVGKGYLNVIKDIGLKEPYIGYSNLVSSEIAEDFAYYFVTSEQTPCAVALGVNIAKDNKVDMAAGYIIEPLPDCSDEVITIIESINTNIFSVTGLMSDLADMDDVAKTISGDNHIELLEEVYPQYECDCSLERIDKTIIALGKEEAFKIADENQGFVEINCNFCNKTYQYNKEMIGKLFQK
ncbi:MAG: Hsp33 family molecular chaperone HslO [Clostridia bacterium]|nr:Hsp33 family molecular chaperone HslO [Clostridia bacterium]